MMVPPRIWVSIEGKKLRIIEDGTMEIVLEKEQHPEKEFIEIESVEGDIAALVRLAIKTCIEKDYERNKEGFTRGP